MPQDGLMGVLARGEEAAGSRPCNDEQLSQCALQSCHRALSGLTQKVRPEKDEKFTRDKPLPKASSGQLPPRLLGSVMRWPGRTGPCAGAHLDEVKTVAWHAPPDGTNPMGS